MESKSAASSSDSMKAILGRLTAGDRQPTPEQAATAMQLIMGGKATPAQMASFLSLLRLDSLTPEVVASCAKIMRSYALPCKPPASAETIDIVGTGGDGIDTFNVSTAAAIIVAAAGGHVLKHGNRSYSSKCGSADILEACGANLMVDGPAAVDVMSKCGFCFLFAQKFHPAMKHVGPVRKEMGIRTIFNILGPLTNPASAKYYVTGVYHKSLGRLYADTLKSLGVKAAMVVHSDEGLDEFSPAGNTHCWVLRAGEVTECDLSPEDFGLPKHTLESVKGGEPAENVATFKAVLEPGDESQKAVHDYIVLNAAAAIFISGMESDYKSAAKRAIDAIQSGKAKATLEQYVRLSKSVEEKSAESASILETIAKARRHTIDTKKAQVSMEQLLFQGLANPPRAPLDVLKRLHASHPMGLMAEIKRASPSKGQIAVGSIDPAKQALIYASAGAAVISVLTEPKWFKGSLEDLRAVSEAVSSLRNRPAVLLKDFVIDPYQLVEARMCGADTALLIVRLLDDATLKSLLATARSLGMEPLVEVADEEETKRAVACGAHFMGINNRNLHTFKVDMTTTEKCAKFIPGHVTFAALSGINTREDVEYFQGAGARAILVGEALMRAKDPAALAKTLLGTADGAEAAAVELEPHRKRKQPAVSSSMVDNYDTAAMTDDVKASFQSPITQLPSKSRKVGEDVKQTSMAKICGVVEEVAALTAADAGASFIGLIFAESKRQIDVASAKQIVTAVRTHFPAGSSSSTTQRLRHDLMDTTGRLGHTEAQYYTRQSELLREWVTAARPCPLIVGVFMNQSVEVINQVIDEVDIDLVQLHGNEGYEVCKAIKRPVVRVVHVPPDATASSVTASVQKGAALLLLDTSKAGSVSGGTGQTFDWSIAQALNATIPVALAGGLTPLNVAEAVSRVRPFAVDVSSGVELSGKPRNKDVNKIRAFVSAVKQT